MEEIQFKAEIRKRLGKSGNRQVRNDEFIPAVVYGGKDPSYPIRVEKKIFQTMYKAHKGEIIVHLNITEDNKKVSDSSAIVKDVQRDPVTSEILHIDFHRISLTEKIEVKVALVAKGEPIGVKQDGGSLEHQIWDLDIKCLPMAIPEKIEVDVSELKIHDTIYVKDIKSPDGVEIKNDPDAIAFSVVPPLKEVSEEDIRGDESQEPEVIKEKKEVSADGNSVELNSKEKGA